jgi:mediator of RNA polymerase II transcription subunit 5
MASHALKQTHRDLDVLMQIFHKLICSAPTSGDAQAMHSTILSIVSSRLEKCFLTLKRRHPSRNDIDTIQQAIKGHLGYERSCYPSVTELEKWTNSSPNTLNAAVRHTVQQLAQWVSVGALHPNPPGYTHRQIYASVKMCGAYRTLRAILEEIKAQTETGNGTTALDIGVSLICAPSVENSPLLADMTTPTPPRSRMNLRETLKAEFDNAATLISSDLTLAETIVRLHRRVEAQLVAVAQAGIPAAQMDMADVGMVDLQTQNAELDKAINDAAVATMAAAAGGDMHQPDQQALQRTLDQHLDLSSAAGGGGLDLSGMGVGNSGAAGDMGADGMGSLQDLDLGDIGGMGMDLPDDDDGWGLDFTNM